MKIICFLTLIGLMLSTPYADIIYAADVPSAPSLLNPLSGDYYMGNDEKIEFKWNPRDGLSAGSDYYDFRVYKGSALNDESLMWEDTLQGDRYQYNLDAERFQDNGVYTWAIRHAVDSLRVSDWSSATFRVIKK